MSSEEILSYTTEGGIAITRTSTSVDPEAAISDLVDRLDEHRGVLLSSGYDYPGRYTRWDIGFCDPPLCLTTRARHFVIEALNARGVVLLPKIAEALSSLEAVESLRQAPRRIDGDVQAPTQRFTEEERSRQPSVFTVLRALLKLFSAPDDPHLGLYGAFGYDLCFQFERIELSKKRPDSQRDLVLYLPDTLIVVDRQKGQSHRHSYDFEVLGRSTHELPREGAREAFSTAIGFEQRCDHAPGEYAEAVQRARESFKCGDLFELVLSQTFFEPCIQPPSALFRNLELTNPAPYALFINLGNAEYLVGASPEMYVRVEGRRVETCPISGTIPRGRDAVEDAERIRELLDSRKDESELTMCTDVDRNDKSRICDPGSVRVIGRRQIEMYSRLIHTVDHVEGRLRPEFDALDAFLSHTWAVTVTGAPKLAAIQRVERDEKSPRAWYGGAIGVIGFNGSLNTGLTLRTIRIQDGKAEVRAGATLLFDSDPDAEELETRVKASAFISAVREEPPREKAHEIEKFHSGEGLRMLLVDHEDSFVHTLANYLRQTGAELVTLRAGFSESELDAHSPHIMVLSPGPGTPSDFQLNRSIEMALARRLPLFGVCLGLQGIVEFFGGELGVLDYPMHGKPSSIFTQPNPLFDGIESGFRAGRYHSLYARRETLPSCLLPTAFTEDGVIMAIEHADLPIVAVQFHPESILSLAANTGLRLLDNAVKLLRAKRGSVSASKSHHEQES